MVENTRAIDPHEHLGYATEETLLQGKRLIFDDR